MFNGKLNVARHLMCNIEEVVLRMVQWKINKCYIFWASVCRLIYPACIVHTPYFLCPACLYKSFQHYIIQGTILENFIQYKICDLIFCTIFLWNISHSKKKRARYDKNMYWSSHKLFVIPVRFQWKFSWNIFEKYNQISLKSLQWEPSCSRGQREGQTDMTKLIVDFPIFVNPPKK